MTNSSTNEITANCAGCTRGIPRGSGKVVNKAMRLVREKEGPLKYIWADWSDCPGVTSFVCDECAQY